MTSPRKWWKLAVAAMALFAAAQVAVSLLVRTHRVHDYLVAHLERAFGRHLDVAYFDAQLLLGPRLDAYRVSVAEDPAFGNEYFLRADRLTAGLRWTGFLRGHFEFGTLSLVRPSLILVRNQAGRWNLENWLPPAKSAALRAALFYGPLALVTPANHLRKIDFDDGRVNFKMADEKLAFALTSVGGSVEQISPGRWQLQLEAQPWRSGEPLQSMGTLAVRGDVAGTSTRLQPAELQVHWQGGSLADLFRLFRGRDYDLRGTFALDATIKSSTGDSVADSGAQPGDWSYSLTAHAAQIHRWDLAERSDNPSVNISSRGHWNVSQGIVSAERLVIETPNSNLRGSARFTSAAASPPASAASGAFHVHFDSIGVQAADLLAWYRAFHDGIGDRVSARQFFTGALTLRGWPFEIESAAFSSDGGELRFPALGEALRIGPLRGGRENDKLTIEPVKVVLEETRATRSSLAATAATTAASAKRHASSEVSGSTATLSFVHDFDKSAGVLAIDGHSERVQDALKLLEQLGRPMNRGWELTGAANAALRYAWTLAPPHAAWNGSIDVSKGELHVAGLNLPLRLSDTRLEWKDGLHAAALNDLQAFGASWSGTVRQLDLPGDDTPANWIFQLHADHLDAAELDRWAGPRARPNWLRRLLPSLLGGAAPDPAASVLLRRVNAVGDLRVDRFTIEKIELDNLRAQGSLRDLRFDLPSIDAQLASGKVHAKLLAIFSPRPSYDIAAALDGVNLALLPGAARPSARFAGFASGSLHLTTQGIGRDELLQTLSGRGDLRLRNVEFHGWDVDASVADGEPREGISRWSYGDGSFSIRNRAITVSALRLATDSQWTLVKGAVTFGRDADLTVQTSGDGQRDFHAIAGARVMKILGSLDVPRVSVETAVARQPAD